eukprot:373283_1
MFCEHGFAKDANGCEICQCNKPESPKCPPVCLMFCPNGNEVDSDGCSICKCKPMPATCEECMVKPGNIWGFQGEGCFSDPLQMMLDDAKYCLHHPEDALDSGN